MRTVEWNYATSQLQMIDQRLLPGELTVAVFDDYREVSQAISDMVVRGAPAIGAAAGFGLALAAQQSTARKVESLHSDMEEAANFLKRARPTAVNLTWALERILRKTYCVMDHGSADDLRLAILNEAQRIADEDVEINKRIAMHGAQLIADGDVIIHHCNTGALATVDWGTALGVIRMAHEQGKKIHVLVDETRPRLQGARLTAWELTQYGIPFDIITDNAAGYFLRAGQAQKVFVGSDRTAANGDVANKIGTYMLALATHDNGVPFYAVVPTSTVDLSLASGGMIPIEERDQAEVLGLTFQGMLAHPEGATARNPAFDVTPHRLITGIITENGVAYPPYGENLERVVKKKETP
ncbi:MAG: S-methyl-5-thioribose-1-phosphate isomerase [Chloroflexi bacterium]|nr:S-methyl-5-thioribose-1-phosphate isomerase [Chloroflexota bacterium]